MATWPVGGYLPQNSATIWRGGVESSNYICREKGNSNPFGFIMRFE
jgi:hypothetical protein